MDPKVKFKTEADAIAFDKTHQKTIDYNMSKYYDAFQLGEQRFSNLEEAKELASKVKSQAIGNLGNYLEQFEENATKNGVQVKWARDTAEALQIVEQIAQKHSAKRVVKSKSMVTEEIGLNDFLEKSNLHVIETDLGEYIVQLAKEKPYHIVTPAMHKNKQSIANLFHEHFGLSKEATPEEITQFTREKLRREFETADLGISGANFLIADTGSISLTENEGNGLLTTSLPPVHVAITGIEKILPSIDQLPLFLPLLSAHGTGQQLTVYNSIISAPKDEGGAMYVILLDNGRSKILQEPEISEALKCIRCGACLNFCPIYKQIGGHTYNSVYQGPIGSVITPYLTNFRSSGHLSYASTLCSRCDEKCPVKIPLSKLLLLNRERLVKKKKRTPAYWFSSLAFRLMGYRVFFRYPNGSIKNRVLGSLQKKLWGKYRVAPHFANKSFEELHKLREKKRRKQGEQSEV